MPTTSMDATLSALIHDGFQTATDGVVMLDDGLNVLYANPVARLILPLPLSVGQPLWSDYELQPAAALASRFRQVIDSGISAEFEEYSPKMRQWLQLRACPSAAGLIVFFRPIDRHLHIKQQSDETRSRFWSMIENLPESVTIADPSGLILGANQATKAMFGFSDEDEWKLQIGQFTQFELRTLDGGLLPLADWPMSRALAGEIFKDFVVEFRRLDTDLRLIGSCAGSPVRNAAGQIIMVIVTVRNITQQIESARQMSASEAFYRSLDDFLPHLLWIMRPDGTLGHVNRRWREFTGRTVEQVNIDGIESLIHPDDRFTYRQIVRNCLDSSGVGEAELRFRQSGGDYRWMLSRWGPVRDRDGAITQWLGTATDIHQSKLSDVILRQTMDTLRQSDLRFQSFMDHSPIMAWINDSAGRVLYMNLTQQQVLNYRDDSRRVPTLWELFPQTEADVYHGENLRVINRGEEIRQTLTIPFADGRQVTHLVIRFPVESDGRIVAAGVAMDISEQQKIEDQLRNAKEAAESANRAKDHFLAILSHELRTPLTPVLLFASALEKMHSLPPEVRADLSMIRQQVQLEARLIDDLLDLTRIQRGKFLLNLQAVSVHEILRRVAALSGAQALSNELHLGLELTAPRDQVMGDPTRLQQVFGNLISNAIKFTPAGGSIVISTRNEQDELVIDVTDTGIGIASDALGRVFNAFEQVEQSITRKYGGLGLGLTIGKAIVEHHHGTLHAASDGNGCGSRLTVRLPINASATVETSYDPASPSAQHGRVLLVEDHPSTRNALQRLLRKVGYEVIAADSVASAVAAGRQTAFDILLCDIGLPDGTGHDVIGQLKAGRSFRAIALSGFGSDDDIRRSLDAGFEQHLIKPADLPTLRAALARKPAPGS